MSSRFKPRTSTGLSQRMEPRPSRLTVKLDTCTQQPRRQRHDDALRLPSSLAAATPALGARVHHPARPAQSRPIEALKRKEKERKGRKRRTFARLSGSCSYMAISCAAPGSYEYPSSTSRPKRGSCSSPGPSRRASLRPPPPRGVAPPTAPPPPASLSAAWPLPPSPLPAAPRPSGLKGLNGEAPAKAPPPPPPAGPSAGVVAAVEGPPGVRAGEKALPLPAAAVPGGGSRMNSWCGLDLRERNVRGETQQRVYTNWLAAVVRQRSRAGRSRLVLASAALLCPRRRPRWMGARAASALHGQIARERCEPP